MGVPGAPAFSEERSALEEEETWPEVRVRSFWKNDGERVHRGLLRMGPCRGNGEWEKAKSLAPACPPRGWRAKLGETSMVAGPAIWNWEEAAEGISVGWSRVLGMVGREQSSMWPLRQAILSRTFQKEAAVSPPPTGAKSSDPLLNGETEVWGGQVRAVFIG